MIQNGDCRVNDLGIVECSGRIIGRFEYTNGIWSMQISLDPDGRPWNLSLGELNSLAACMEMVIHEF